MNACHDNRCAFDEGMNVSVSPTKDRKMKKSSKQPAMVAVLRKMPPKPQRAARLFQPKVEKKPISTMALRTAPKKDRVKDIKVRSDKRSEFEPIQKGILRKAGRKSNRPGERLFDRRSGSNRTGVKAVDKRNGAGAHNWGSLQQEIDLRQKTNSHAFAFEMKLSKVSSFAANNDPSEEPEQYTLDEWRAMQARKKQLLRKFIMADTGGKDVAKEDGGATGATGGADGPGETDSTKAAEEASGGAERSGDTETAGGSEASEETVTAEATGEPDASGGCGASGGSGESGELEDEGDGAGLSADRQLYVVDILLNFHTDQGIIPYRLKFI
ncbi:AF4/FMR2 family member lilli [Drosophila teissieri]|uniref:AF4/FMR2 family member lilli n=1 Tax=Drosophila teissieri TaxID=7243 RepID=UPI001CBA1D89|nr:AF4/FMR2 family member lilli [Drosophila teissieri]